MNINERFKEVIRTLYAGNKRSFAQSVGVSATVIENVVGTRNGKPSYDVLEKICANANISAEWLLTGRGAMLRDKDTQLAAPVVQEQFSLRTDRMVGLQNIPLYELDASAGLVDCSPIKRGKHQLAISKYPVSPHAMERFMCEVIRCIHC